ncbi:Angiotensin-converting enzyme [Frankliniella fusca]|uniref:Angiotensin-converting enzyme n=1 Tax=Frankliniella fusca TaxID=407009 RepID=A0AAE1HYB5_9NEOP|nr:Angiotensin-converting enzyme [Frankliniella fusca]
MRTPCSALQCLLCLLVLAPGPAPAQSQPQQDTQYLEASQFLREYDREAAAMCFRVTSATWGFSTNVTESNRRRMLEEQALSWKFGRVSWRKATSLSWARIADPAARRQLQILAQEGRNALADDRFAELMQLIGDMKDVYARARVCPTTGVPGSATCDWRLEPELSRVLARSRDPAELLRAWTAWHDAVGPQLRAKYVRYVQLANEAARLNGFRDAGEHMRAPYDDPELESEVTQLWAQVSPLYRQLHAYVRRQLHRHYGDLVREDGPLPAHLLGNMWAQSWKNIADLVVPFPEKRGADVTPEMLRQGYTPVRMFQTAEEFFTSLGLKPMSMEFWRHSMLERPVDREVVCRASAWDFCNRKDYRIKQCTEVTMDDLLTIHHEMAHIQYYLHYAEQPYIFRRGANPAFHEAIGDAIGLSVSTPRHLQRIGLLNNITDDYETNINYLLTVALDKVVYLPFAYVVDQWRWRVFSEGVENMNGRWWELRMRHQGVIPPVPRTERDFDPGAKYHVPADTPYLRYFISLVLQFQIHEALCRAAGHPGPLHTCDIYRSREAGRLLAEVLSLGASRPWRDVIRVATQGATDRLDARPLLDYFQPLALWLRVQNRERGVVGWTTTSQETALFARWARPVTAGAAAASPARDPAAPARLAIFIVLTACLLLRRS